jgi:hypothetical protein
MGDIFPDEGLDYLLSIVPKNGASPSNLFMGLYTAAGGTSVPASNATLAGLAGAGTVGFAEVSATLWTTYTRQTHVSGSWGAQGASVVWTTTGRIVTGGQLTFPAPSAPYAPALPIAGFFLSNNYTTGVACYYSNFSDTNPIASLAIGDLVKVTPSFGFGNY